MSYTPKIITYLAIILNITTSAHQQLLPTISETGQLSATEILSTVATTRIQESGDGDSSREPKRPVHPIFPKELKIFELLRTNGLHHLRL